MRARLSQPLHLAGKEYELDVRSYLYTSGATAFWSEDGSEIVQDSRLPPAGQQSRVLVRTPEAIYEAPGPPPTVQAYPSVPAERIVSFLKTPEVHDEDGCSVEIAFSLEPAIRLPPYQATDLFVYRQGQPEEETFPCSQSGGSAIDRAKGWGTCMLQGIVCATLLPTAERDSLHNISIHLRRQGGRGPCPGRCAAVLRYAGQPLTPKTVRRDGRHRERSDAHLCGSRAAAKGFVPCHGPRHGTRRGTARPEGQG